MASNALRDTVNRNALVLAREGVKMFPEHKMMCEKFIRTFEAPEDDKEDQSGRFGRRKYKALLQRAANRNAETIHVDMEDLERFCEKEYVDPDPDMVSALMIPRAQAQASAEQLAKSVQENALRYLRFFFDACVTEMPERDADFNTAKAGLSKDTIYEWRKRLQEAQKQAGLAGAKTPIPSRLTHAFDIRFKPSKSMQTKKLREIKASEVGGLVQIDCVVVRTSSVKPKVEVVTYHCDTCQCEIFQVVEGERYNPTAECISERCKANNTGGKLVAHIRTSKFVRFQEMKVQEMSSHVPVGGVPKSLTVQLQSDLVRGVLPGDSIRVTGIYMPFQQTVMQAQQRGAVQDMYIDAHHVEKHKKGYTETTGDEEELDAEIAAFAQSGDLYERASKSIGPEIFGHIDIKKCLLLVLVGGATKTMTDGMRIRGDIHLLLMGDPGVAKSQLLRQICNMAPRSVYTTGKGSSGVGLTAAVTRDNSTGEVTLEGGALVLADKGICCIDEFDKMEESDRTAIHEVMEQQTVSIAKAGITTTLNARASVCAAANPQYGRYNPYKSVQDNIALPESLLSRFDIIFLLLDLVTRENDMNLAQHVLKVHSLVPADGQEKGDTKGRHAHLDFVPLEAKLMRRYVSLAREKVPLIDDTLIGEIADAYVEMRSTEDGEKFDNRKTYTTPRQLLAMLRLSQAVARARFADKVVKADFDEALRLIRVSKESIEKVAENNRNANPLDLVFEIIADCTKASATGWVDVSMAESMAGARGISPEVVQEAVQHYEELNVWTTNEAKTQVKFYVVPE